MLTLDPKNLHHAYLIEGDKKKAEEVFTLLESFGIPIQANPDLFYKTYETFGIDEARELRQIQNEKSLSGKRFFILVSENFTLEAMQALLKVFEEPILGNHFFIITPQINFLIPTLRSRFFIIPGKQEALEKEAENFLKLSKKERLDVIQRSLAKSDRFLVTKLLSGLELVMKRNQAPINSFEKLWQVKRFLQDRGVSVKMILEHLALSLDKNGKL